MESSTVNGIKHEIDEILGMQLKSGNLEKKCMGIIAILK